MAIEPVDRWTDEEFSSGSDFLTSTLRMLRTHYQLDDSGNPIRDPKDESSFLQTSNGGEAEFNARAEQTALMILDALEHELFPNDIAELTEAQREALLNMWEWLEPLEDFPTLEKAV